MINEFLFQELKEYLTKEYMHVSDQKEELTRKKIELQVENDAKETFLFEKKDIDAVKRLFSPLKEDIFECVKNNSTENKNSVKMEEIENNVNKLNSSMEKLKNYISFVQLLEENWKQNELVEEDLKEEELIEEEIVEEDEVFGISDHTKEMILTTIDFLETQYPEIDFVLDMIEDEIIISAETNANMIRVLTYTISSTIETFQLDTVKIDLKQRRDYIVLTLQMICNDEIIGQYIHKYLYL